MIPIIEPIRPTIATIETPIVCEPSFEEEIISSPLPPTRRGSKRSVKPVPGLDEILIEESVPKKNQTFKRVIFRLMSGVLSTYITVRFARMTGMTPCMSSNKQALV